MKRLSDDWNDVKSLVIYGYGRKAVRMIDFISKDFKIDSIIDNDPKLKGKVVHEIIVQPLEVQKETIKNKKILVTVGGVSYFSIKNSLEGIGLVEYIDFCSYEVFLTEWYWNNRKKVIMSESYITITSHCTFRCKNCDQLMPYYNKNTHWEKSVAEIDETLEAFFTKADYLVSFFVVGGEPLLYKKLPQLMTMICEKYGDRIGYVQIITNASIIPDDKLMSVIKKYNIDIRLSDYTCSINYAEKLEKVKAVLASNGIDYSMSKYEKWYDTGIPGIEDAQFDSIKNIKQHAIDCAPCHVIADKKFYYCGSYYNSVKCGFIDLTEDGYIDLEKETTLESKLELLSYSRGNVKNGYLNVCNHCFGKSGKNLKEVEPAIQMEGNNNA